MNAELKALISLVVGVVRTGIDIYENKGITATFGNLQALAGHIMPVIQNWPNLQSELRALSGTAQEKDLLEFIAKELNLLITDPKAQQVLSSSVKIVTDLTLDSNSLVQTVKALRGTKQ